jgi:hypothetical protein
LAGEWILEGDAFEDVSLIIPERLFSELEQTVLTFETPDATSPKALGLSDDIRSLGFCLNSITLDRATNVRRYEWGEVLRFGTEGNAQPFQTSGWAVPEPGISWNDGGRAILDLLVSRPTTKPLTLRASLKPFIAGSRKEQRVRVIANGEQIGEWRLRTDDFRSVSARIPARLIKEQRVRLVFETPDATSPAELGVSPDERRLAIALESLQLIEGIWVGPR